MDAQNAALRAQLAIPLVAVALLLVAPALESHAQTVVFTDDFTRSNSASLGGGWVEAEGGASTIRIESNRAQMDLNIGPGNGVDLVHAVNVQNTGPSTGSAFTPKELTLRAFVVSTYMSGGFTSPHGVGLANPANSDLDHIMFYVQGEGDGQLDGYLVAPSVGTVPCGTNIGASDGVGYNELRLVIDDLGDGTTRLDASFAENGSGLGLVCFLVIPTASLLSTATLKIGNPGADGDTGLGSARQGDVLINFVSVSDDDLDDDGVANASDICPYDSDPGQEDTDSDGAGDACNDAVDFDGDDWADGYDNCPNESNPGQDDADSDGEGDVCDNDLDPTLFSDDFDRADGSSLGASWVEAEAAASTFGVSGRLGVLDLELGGGVGVDVAHAVTVQTFAPEGLRVAASVRETPLAGGFTKEIGLGLADPNDDDVDILMFWLLGQGDGMLDAYFDRPDPGGPGPAPSLFAADVAASDGIEFNEMTFQIASDGTSVTAWLNGETVFGSVALDPADLPGSVTIKIGNPGADGDSGSGSARLGDVEYNLVRVTDAEPDMDGDGMGDAFEVANGFDPLDGDEDSNGTPDGQDDEDADGLGNAAEERIGTDPNDADTDDDGLLDGTEIGTGSFGGQQVITDLADWAFNVFAADVDGDGDTDVLSASYADDKIAWYENTDGAGTFGGQQVISTAADGPWSVFAADIDRDGDLDVLSASAIDTEIAWYENLDGAGTFGGQNVITNSAIDARSVVAADLDGDFDLDVLSASAIDNKIAWYENTDGAGSFGGQQTITTAILQATSVFAADIDGDGDTDVLSSSQVDDRIAWYENIDGAGTFGGVQTITTLADSAQSVHAADLDGDGDVDVLSASADDDKVAWYENTDGAGAFGSQQVISTAGNGSRWVSAADVDGDGDLDVLAAAESDNEIAWYENTDGAGGFGGHQVISALAESARTAIAADVDGDGDLDALSASYLDDEIAWYPQTNFSNPFEVDSDGDGLCDGNVTVGACVGNEGSVGSDPLDSDSDDDGLDDATEVAAGTSPILADTDSDGVCDGSLLVAPCSTVGPDNCPLYSGSADQTNSDAHPAGDVCQCGDLDNDGIIGEADLQRVREEIVGATHSGTFVPGRCSVTGGTDDCDLSDAFRIGRFLGGQVDAIDMVCAAYFDLGG